MATETNNQSTLAKAVAWTTVAGGIVAVLAFLGVTNWHDLPLVSHKGKTVVPAASVKPLPAPSQVVPSEIHDELGDVYRESGQTSALSWEGPDGYNEEGTPCSSTGQCLGIVQSLDLYTVQGQNKRLDVRIYAFPDASDAASEYVNIGSAAFPFSSCVASRAKVSGRFIVAVRASYCTGQSPSQSEVAALAAVDQIGQAFTSL